MVVGYATFIMVDYNEWIKKLCWIASNLDLVFTNEEIARHNDYLVSHYYYQVNKGLLSCDENWLDSFRQMINTTEFANKHNLPSINPSDWTDEYQMLYKLTY